ncbi:hypothetical protein JTB14_032693 [Gonioctena quinquepunctata]|nr:hypothetical protein JTB14_032693 [Gonioctena quinquepunctata]
MLGIKENASQRKARFERNLISLKANARRSAASKRKQKTAQSDYDEVKQLKTDLETANLEVKELKKALYGVNKSHEEKTFNLNLITKKCAKIDSELQEKREYLITLQMQHKMSAAENEIFKEKLQESESERVDLTRKLENLEAKQRHDSIYHNAILKRETNLRAMMGEINEMMTKLKKEHDETMTLSNQTKVAEISLEKLQHLSKNYEKLKREKENFEELYIKANAKCEKFQELMSSRSEVHDPNLITKIIFSHWRINRASYTQTMEDINKILAKVTESYTSEKTVNIQLICRNEELTELLHDSKCEIQNLKCERKSLKEAHGKEVEELKTKIEEFEKKNDISEISEVIEIKNELIEIGD